MKIFIVLMLALSSLSALACRPNIYAIQNKILLKGVTAVAQTDNLEGLTGVKFITGVRMAHVARPSNGINCPDQYSATVGVNLKERCFSVDVVYSTFIDRESQSEAPVAVEVKCE